MEAQEGKISLDDNHTSNMLLAGFRVFPSVPKQTAQFTAKNLLLGPNQWFRC